MIKQESTKQKIREAFKARHVCPNLSRVVIRSSIRRLRKPEGGNHV